MSNETFTLGSNLGTLELGVYYGGPLDGRAFDVLTDTRLIRFGGGEYVRTPYMQMVQKNDCAPSAMARVFSLEPLISLLDPIIRGKGGAK